MAVISFALPSQINICVDTDTVVTPCRLESEKNRWICFGTNKLYRNKVLVHPDCVEIPLNKVPTNLLPPSEPQDKSATSRLSIFYIEKMCDNPAPPNQTGDQGCLEYNFLVKLHRKEQKKSKSRRKGHKETRAKNFLTRVNLVEPNQCRFWRRGDNFRTNRHLAANWRKVWNKPTSESCRCAR